MSRILKAVMLLVLSAGVSGVLCGCEKEPLEQLERTDSQCRPGSTESSDNPIDENGSGGESDPEVDDDFASEDYCDFLYVCAFTQETLSLVSPTVTLTLDGKIIVSKTLTAADCHRPVEGRVSYRTISCEVSEPERLVWTLGTSARGHRHSGELKIVYSPKPYDEGEYTGLYTLDGGPFVCCSAVTPGYAAGADFTTRFERREPLPVGEAVARLTAGPQRYAFSVR